MSDRTKCDVCGETADELMQRADWPGVTVEPGITRAPMVCKRCAPFPRTARKRAGKRSRAYSGGAKKRSSAPGRRFSRIRARRRSTAKKPASIGQSIEYFRKDGYNDGRNNADLSVDDYEGLTPSQVAKNMRRQAKDPNVLHGTGYWEAALEHSEGSKAGARKLLNAYLDAFEDGIKAQIQDLKDRRAEDREYEEATVSDDERSYGPRR